MPLRKLPLKKCRDSTTCIYKDLKILKFRDHITQQNWLFVFSFEQNPLLLSSFKIFYFEHTHNYSARSANKTIFDIPYSQTYTYGITSVIHSCIKDWNNFKRSFPKLFQGQLTYSRINQSEQITYLINIKPQKIISQFIPLYHQSKHQVNLQSSLSN